MSRFLHFLAFATAIVTAIAGLVNGGLVGLLLGVVVSIPTAAIFAALGTIIDNQERILHRLPHDYKPLFQGSNTVPCSKCGKDRSPTGNNCPHCGHSE